MKYIVHLTQNSLMFSFIFIQVPTALQFTLCPQNPQYIVVKKNI